MVFCHILHLYRPEGAQSHMEGNVCHSHSLFLQFPEQLFGKMQSRRRRRRRAVISGIYGLVTVLILQLMGNIRRQGHLPKTVQYFLKNPFIRKADLTVAILLDADNLSPQFPLPEDHLCSGPRLFPWLYKGFPYIILMAL